MSSIGSVPDHSLAPFFGGVDPQYQKLLAEDKFAHETFNLPKAYEGKNKHLECALQADLEGQKHIPNVWFFGFLVFWF